jgi:hypothetical protein
MTYARTLVAGALGLVLLAGGVDAQGVASESAARYRNFELRSSLASVSASAGLAVSEAKTIHQRPAVLQDLDWRPSRWVTGSPTTTDPVEQVAFSFYNDQLFRIVVDYGHDRTEGMTNADMVDALSAVYGATVTRAPGARLASVVEIESGSPLARWGDAANTVVLYRTNSSSAGFRLIVTEPALESLARKATLQAVRLDDQEAPLREQARHKKEQDDGRAAAEKARTANKGGFVP